MIEVKNLTFSYGKDKQALHGLDFAVEDGEIFGFLGPNGSGKSTTQKILTGILKGHGGKVSLFGQDISAAYGPEFFRKIGVLFEFPYLYANLSAVDKTGVLLLQRDAPAGEHGAGIGQQSPAAVSGRTHQRP